MRLLNEDAMVVGDIGNNFKFSGIRTEHLGASEYTLVNVGVDTTGSTAAFTDQLRQCLVAAVESCRKSPRADNLLIRVFTFHSSFNGGGIEELHGFKPLSEIASGDYPHFQCGGMTNLYDAAYAAVKSSHSYAEQLTSDDYPNNIINIIITDGEDNQSTMSAGDVKREVDAMIHSEQTESCINILVGINDTDCRSALEDFQKNAGFDKYIPAGDVTPAKIAKLADFISQSISSQSQSLGTGGPSQNIKAII